MELCRRLAPLPEAATSAAGPPPHWPLSLLGSRIAPLLDDATVPAVRSEPPQKRRLSPGSKVARTLFQFSHNNTSRRLHDKTFNPFVRLDGCGRTVAGAVEKGTCHFTWEGATRAVFGSCNIAKGVDDAAGGFSWKILATEWNE